MDEEKKLIIDITQHGKTKQPWLGYDGLDNQLDYFL
jgi:hypothetical protein